MPAMALSRVAARAVESGPDGENLAAGAWQRLEALPDPRSPQGRIYPLACLIAIALCAFTAAGNDRFTAVGQWIKRAGQADLARLHAPWDPIAGRYRAPDKKTIRVVLDRLDPRALTRALLGPRPHGRRGGPASASVRGYRARRAAQRARTLARGRVRAVAVDGKTSRGARRPDGTRVHLLGVAEHGAVLAAAGPGCVGAAAEVWSSGWVGIGAEDRLRGWSARCRESGRRCISIRRSPCRSASRPTRRMRCAPG